MIKVRLTKIIVTTVNTNTVLPCFAVSSACRAASAACFTKLFVCSVDFLACRAVFEACFAMFSACLRAEFASETLACFCFRSRRFLSCPS
jgi:hypothetical protein